MAGSSELQWRIAEFSREMAVEFGHFPESDEPLITQIEDKAVEIGDAVMAKMMELSLQSQTAIDSQQCCPSCGRIGHRKGNRDRILQTRRGDVRMEEVEYHCSACRQSFFPDVQTIGN